MTLRRGLLAAIVSLGVAVPLGAYAQQPPQKGAQRAAPARPAAAPHAAPRPAPMARPAPAPHPQPMVRAAPQRPAPQMRAIAPHPAPQQRAIAPRPMPQHMARPPQMGPQRAARPQPGPQRAATQQRGPAAINRAARQEQRQQQRAQRQQLQQQRVQRSQQQRSVKEQAQPNANPRVLQRQQRALVQQQQRQERTLRAQENRQLRRLPPSQRAERRQEINRAREQRAAARQQQFQRGIGAAGAAGAVGAAAIAQPNAQTARGPRRNGQQRVTADQARQGRFAAAFNARAQARDPSARPAWTSARRAWRSGRRAAFVGWYGPVFWPYAYSDVFDYTFWPAGYDDGYWYTAYDGFFDGVFWGEQGPPEDYVYGYGDAGPAGAAPVGAPPSASSARPTYAAVQELCKQPGSGVTAWPFADIEKKVGLNDEQKQLLADVRNAAQTAAGEFKASCPAENAFPLTPPGRLAAMTARLQATLETVQTVRPALDKFYASLSDEQKERFNEIGPKQQPATTAQASQETTREAQSCKEQKPGLSNLPIEKIEDVVKPTDAQETGLNALQTATDKAVSIMQAACPDDTPITPPGRLEAMEKRLQAMIDAANTVKPALDDFYASLTNEQKARFNRIGRELAQANN
jgi:LTXXQ motif family protein